MEAFDVLGDPVRRRIIELIAAGERSSGEVTATVRAEFGISQPAVSQHLRILRESGFATVRPEGTRRLYALDAHSLDGVVDWLDELRRAWGQHLDALDTELARGRRQRRLGGSGMPRRGRPDPTATDDTHDSDDSDDSDSETETS